MLLLIRTEYVKKRLCYQARLCRSLIIEFVAKEDGQVKRLLASREDIFHNYSQEHFEQAVKEYFAIDQSVRINNSERTMYLLKNRACGMTS